MIPLSYCNAANILYAVPYAAKSHYISLRPIGLELARRGHNVTVITAHRETDHPPTYHQVMVKDTKIWDVLGGDRPNVFSLMELSAEEFHQKYLWPGGLALTEDALQSRELQDLFASDAKFDLVISEQFFQEAFYALADKYNAPLALVTTYGNSMKHNIMTRNPLQFWYLEKQEQLVKKYIPGLQEPVPSLYDIQKNTSLMLLNSHFSVDGPVAYLPNIVEIGGIHLTKNGNSLPEDLQKFIDDAEYGVVYVSFGSNVKSSEMSKEKKQAFINVFKRLKQRVLFKWEEDTLENKPDNVMIRKWLPQKEILAHPNIKVFISHGGLIGTQETIFNGVPAIGIPVFSDQLNNILLMQEMGFGKLLKYHDITEERLYSLLQDVLNNETYMTKAKEVSRRFKDRPMNALDTAMFWLEYTIRNKGGSYMKNPAIQLSWFAYTMLDIYIFLAFILIALVYVIGKFISLIKALTLSEKATDKIKRS